MWSQTIPIEHIKGALTNNNRAQQNSANGQKRLKTYNGAQQEDANK
jgi:hypothetical protein